LVLVARGAVARSPYEALTGARRTRAHAGAMRITTLSILAALALTACGDRNLPTPSEPAAAAVPEVVDHEARLAAVRAQQIARLEAYRAAGEYTTDERGYPTGVFKDAAGRRCPMAHLIHLSGRDDLVDETARTNNRLQLADVHDGPLMAWMLDSGLTQEEIVMVQGVMNIEWDQRGAENVVFLDESALIASAHDEVGRRIDAAVAQLRANTEISLEVALARR
jgi:hypothetical protein